MKRNKIILGVLIVSMITLVFSGCGGSGGVPTVPSTPEPSEEFVLVQVTNPESNLIFVIGKEDEDAMAILGDKDTEGNPTDITGAVYVSEQGDSFAIEAGIDGLPTYLIDSEGNKVIFENYTNSTVDISIYDSSGSLIQEATTINLDPADLLKLKQLYNSFYPKGLRWDKENTADALKWGAVGLSAIGCGLSIYGTYQTGGALALTPAVGWACGKFSLSLIAATTPTDTDNKISMAIGGGSCILSGGYDVYACGSSITNTINLAIDGQSVDTNHPPAISDLSANPPSVNIDQTTTITCIASDQDGDPLTYHWTKNAGSFEGSTSDSSVTWRAPSTPGTYTITCSISDGKGGQDSEPINIVVKPDEKEEIENVLEKFGSAMDNQNWGKAKTYCVPNSQAVGSVDEYASAINELNSICDEWDVQCNWSSNEGTIVISGSNATATTPDSSCTLTCVVGTEEFSISGSGYDIYYLKKIDGNWLISEIGGNAAIDPKKFLFSSSSLKGI